MATNLPSGTAQLESMEKDELGEITCENANSILGLSDCRDTCLVEQLQLCPTECGKDPLQKCPKGALIAGRRGNNSFFCRQTTTFPRIPFVTILGGGEGVEASEGCLGCIIYGQQ